MTHRSPAARRVAAVLAAITFVAACGSDDDSGSDPTATETADTPADADADADDGDADADPGDADADDGAATGVVAGEPFDADRCAANEEAGTITFLTGFDFAAAASIVEVIVADAEGYYEDLCLDVELLPSFSTSNYPLVASGDAQFASGGSFSEVVAFDAANDADLVAVTVDAHTPIETLIVTDPTVQSVDDIAGTTVGVKGKLPTAIDVMLRDAGLVEGTDYDTVLLDGFDPIAHAAIDAIVGFSAWQSNEPGTLERAGVEFSLLTPGDTGVPGSFGAIFTSQEFIDAHPTAAEDFVRATLLGLETAMADPDAAAQAAVDLINANGNPNFLSPEGEAFRWSIEVGLIEASTPDGSGPAIPDPVRLQEELDAAAAVGLFGDGDTPVAADEIATGLAAGIYDGSTVIWPA